MSLAKDVKKELAKAADKQKAKFLMRFFKTGEGQYGYGDLFLGINVPVQRQIARSFRDLPLNEIQILLKSKFHEHRLVALLILCDQFSKTKDEKIVEFYLSNLKLANNWDLVDSSAHQILGNYLAGKDRSTLYRLAKSDNLWKRRVSIVSTFAFIRKKDLDDTFKISEMLLNDKQDLMHKAVGWMLREAGKKDEKALIKFLDKNYKKMPRTALRYSFERLSENKRKNYMKK